jgi:hypothetical protein
MKNGLGSRFWIGLCLTLFSGCKFETSATPATQVVVDVDAEPLIRARMSELKILVEGARHRDYLDERTPVLDQTLPTVAGNPEGLTWPVRLVLEPKADDPRRVFDLSVTALDAGGQVAAQGRLITGYLSHQIRYARIVLEDDCYKARCAELETCRSGGCTDAFVEPRDLPLLSGRDAGIDGGEAGVSDTGPPPEKTDAGKDAGQDAGPDAGPDSGPPPIDPCLKNNGGCDSQVSCLSVEGVPTCGQCPSGFIDVNGDGARCEDIDECLKGKAGCDRQHGVCTNTPGGYDCACAPGFNGTGRDCAVNVPCREDPAVCDTLATCQDIQGERVCQCKPGYQGNGGSCTDIDECARKLDNCVTHATCSNTEGSFSCTCDPGYVMMGAVCADVDECMLGMDNCDNMPDACQNVDGSFICKCPPGYTGSGVGDTCQDIDECAMGMDNCDSSPDACKNTVGGFMCVCPAGYEGLGVGANGCADIDECQRSLDACDDSPDACVNDVGGTPGYHCACPPGYDGNGMGANGCTDMDQCAMNADNCDTSPEACVNDIGGLPGFHCACPAGYMGDGVGGNGCVDIDECAMGVDNCDDMPDACHNVNGSFMCECPPGYVGTGIGDTCQDVDECAMNMDDCDDAPNACVNEIGISGSSRGFHCTCPAGYSGNGVGANGCAEVDECSSPGTNTCDTSPAACVNDIGGTPGYHCTCPSGYTGDGVGANGCMDKDECAAGGGNDCNANADCTNTPAGSFTCTCKAGYTGTGHGASGCMDKDECAAGGGSDCNVNADCTNTPAGSFTCTCKAGYTGTGHGTGGCTDLNACVPTNPCMNNGDCADNPPGAATPYSCSCKCGYSGTECQTAPSTNTIGPTSFGMQASQALQAGVIYALPIDVGASNRTLVGFGIGGATGSVNVRIGLYSNAGSSPSNRLYESGSVALSSGITAVSPCVVLDANSTVWMVVLGSGDFSVAGEMGGVNANRYRMTQPFDMGLPASFTPTADPGPNLALYLVTAPAN